MANLECQNLQAAATIALQGKEDVEAMCADLVRAVTDLWAETDRNEQSMVASAQKIQGLEATVATLTKSGEDKATRLRGATPSSLCIVFSPTLLFGADRDDAGSLLSRPERQAGGRVSRASHDDYPPGGPEDRRRCYLEPARVAGNQRPRRASRGSWAHL